MSWFWTCEPGWEQALQAELTRTAPRATHRVVAPGWLHSESPDNHGACTSADSKLSVALASQCLPQAIACSAPSISTWARLLGESLMENLRDHTGAWRLHLFSHYAPGDVSGPRRIKLLGAALDDLLRRKQRRLLRTRILEAATPWRPDEVLVQLGLMDANRGALSICPAALRDSLRHVVSRFPGGAVNVSDEPAAPSRAYRKLAEVQIRLNRLIAAHERCVDLGSSPGSWAWLAVQHGAAVIAIDRSPLRDDLMHHPRLHFIQGDAFRYVPEEPVDWLLCDLIAFPARTLELMERWLRNRWCRQFCVTIKFRGQEEHARLEEAKQLLAKVVSEYCLRRLTNNRNEVTAYGYAINGEHNALC